MSTNFPTSQDTFTNPTPESYLNSPAHSSQHADANDAIEAIEAYVLRGISTSTFVLSNYDTLKLAIDAIEAAGGGELILDGGTWEFSSLERNLPSNITFRCILPTTIKVPDGVASTVDLFYCLGISNIAWIDPMRCLTLDGNRDNRAEHDSEFGMNIELHGCSNVYVEVGHSINSHGDGLYIGSYHTATPAIDYCTNVTIKYIDCDNNFRNGISVISVDGLFIDTAISHDSNGAVSSNGFDVEPDYDYQRISNVNINYLYCYGNEKRGLDMGANSAAITQPGNITIQNLVIEDNDAHGILWGNDDGNAIHIEINNIKVYKNGQCGVLFQGSPQNTHIGTVWAVNNGQDGVADAGLDSGVVFDHTGGASDANNMVIDTIIAYDDQVSKTQQYALFGQGDDFEDNSCFVGKIIDLGNVKSTDPVSVHLVMGNSGWIPLGSAWTYLSPTTITCPNGIDNILGAGDKIKIFNVSWKYFDVVSATDTVLTISGGATYTLANAAISGQRYSHQFSPLGYPAAGL